MGYTKWDNLFHEIYPIMTFRINISFQQFTIPNETGQNVLENIAE
jgi:hypothetical protein